MKTHARMNRSNVIVCSSTCDPKGEEATAVVTELEMTAVGRGATDPTYKIWPQAATPGVEEASFQIDSGRSVTPNHRWCQSSPDQNVGTCAAIPERILVSKLPYYSPVRRRHLIDANLDVLRKSGKLVRHPNKTQSYK